MKVMLASANIVEYWNIRKLTNDLFHLKCNFNFFNTLNNKRKCIYWLVNKVMIFAHNVLKIVFRLYFFYILPSLHATQLKQ